MENALGYVLAVVVVLGFGYFIYKKVTAKKDSTGGSGGGGGSGGNTQQK